MTENKSNTANLILKELVLYQPENNKKRFGSLGDGGYVIVDGYDYDYYIGGGIGENPSFDIQFLQTKPDITGLVFDATIKYYPFFSNHVYYVHKNIGSDNTLHTTNLNNETKYFQNIFMKMDIDGHEINWLKNFNNLNKIKQLVIEIHGLFPEYTLNSWDWCESAKFEYKNVYEILKKLNNTHHLVHFHSNSSAGYTTVNNKKMPTVVELTFIRKNDCKIIGLNKTTLPISELDFPNGFDREDLYFTEYPFVSE